MTIHHLSEDIYLIVTDHADPGVAPWRHRSVSFHAPDYEARLEWVVIHKTLKGFGLGAVFGRNGMESDVGLDLYFAGLGSAWFRMRSPWTSIFRVEENPEDRYDYLCARKTGVRMLPYWGSLIQVLVEDRDGTWSKGQPWWRDFGLNVSDIMGRTRGSMTVLRSGAVQIPMPEGSYDGTYEIRRYVTEHVGRLGWLRDRVLGRKTHDVVSIDVPGGIPVEGKGENSWDCGMDGVFGQSIPGSSVEVAVGALVGSVLKDRRRHGGPHDLERPTTVSEAS